MTANRSTVRAETATPFLVTTDGEQVLVTPDGSFIVTDQGSELSPDGTPWQLLTVGDQKAKIHPELWDNLFRRQDCAWIISHVVDLPLMPNWSKIPLGGQGETVVMACKFTCPEGTVVLIDTYDRLAASCAAEFVRKNPEFVGSFIKRRGKTVRVEKRRR